MMNLSMTKKYKNKQLGTFFLNKCDMGKELKKLSEPYFNFIFLGNENVNDIQKHGISDKGSTIFIFRKEVTIFIDYIVTK